MSNNRGQCGFDSTEKFAAQTRVACVVPIRCLGHLTLNLGPEGPSGRSFTTRPQPSTNLFPGHGRRRIAIVFSKTSLDFFDLLICQGRKVCDRHAVPQVFGKLNSLSRAEVEKLLGKALVHGHRPGDRNGTRNIWQADRPHNLGRSPEEAWACDVSPSNRYAPRLRRCVLGGKLARQRIGPLRDVAGAEADDVVAGLAPATSPAGASCCGSVERERRGDGRARGCRRPASRGRRPRSAPRRPDRHRRRSPCRRR